MYSSTILLVNPLTEGAVQLRFLLEERGYRVVDAANTTSAMEIMNRSEVALVVTDLYLPVGKSRCLARAVRRAPALRRTKVLAYTSHGRRRDRNWAKSAGAHGYVITRSGEERLLHVVDHLMRKRAEDTTAI